MDVRRSLSAPQLAGVAALLVIACVLPFVVGNYTVFQLTMAMSYAIALLGLNMLTGYNGQISLGHGAFFAIGAYTAAILMDKGNWPYWATIPVAGLVCLAAGFLFGLPALRLEGLYLALATFALGVAMPQILKYKGFEHWTGGSMGVVIMKPDPPEGIPLNQDQWLYFFTLLWVLILFAAGWNILRGRVGRALVAIRDHPIAAQAMGVNTAMYKSLTFGVSALYTGIAGALASIAVQFASPDSFSVFLSLTLLVGVVVGGLASISGAFYGALFIQFIPNIADRISKAAPWAIYGVFLIAFMYLMPSGVAGLIAMARRRFVKVPVQAQERKQDDDSTQDPRDRRGHARGPLPEHRLRAIEEGNQDRADHAV
jgi:branched-chain amino acid transport system permease protein